MWFDITKLRLCYEQVDFMVRVCNEGFLRVSFENPVEYEKPDRIYPFANSRIFESEVIRIVPLTKGEDVKDIYEITLDLTDIDYDYQPGDTIGILPHNNSEEVNDILQILNCTDAADQECYFYVENEKKRRNFAHIPTASTLRDIFLKAVDVRSPAKKGFLKTLSKYCGNDEDTKFLEHLCLPNKSEDYMRFISNEGRTLLSLLSRVPSCKPPIDVVIENLTPLQPRPYSVASSPLLKNKFCIIFSIINVTGDLKGVCSSYLHKVGHSCDIIKFYFRKPSLRISENSSPVIMVGPGTGIAPFLGFLQHLFLLKQQADTWLFYGCRYKDRDFLYQHELEKYLDDGCLSKLSVAFSREQIDKIYVIDCMYKESNLLYKKIVHENAIFVVCGDAKNMVKDVRDAVIGCLEENGMLKNEADDFIKVRIKENKYVEDSWV